MQLTLSATLYFLLEIHSISDYQTCSFANTLLIVWYLGEYHVIPMKRYCPSYLELIFFCPHTRNELSTIASLTIKLQLLRYFFWRSFEYILHDFRIYIIGMTFYRQDMYSYVSYVYFRILFGKLVLEIKFFGYRKVIYEYLMSAYFGILGLSLIGNRFAIILFYKIFFPIFLKYLCCRAVLIFINLPSVLDIYQYFLPSLQFTYVYSICE